MKSIDLINKLYFKTLTNEIVWLSVNGDNYGYKTNIKHQINDRYLSVYEIKILCNGSPAFVTIKQDDYSLTEYIHDFNDLSKCQHIYTKEIVLEPSYETSKLLEQIEENKRLYTITDDIMHQLDKLK